MTLMPVAKKTTNKNKTSLIQKLKLNTLKGRMIATVLVFALIGGGFMVYRSFAATGTTTASYSLSGNNLKGSQQASGGSWKSVVFEGFPRLEVNGPAFAEAIAGSTWGHTANNGKTYITCALVRKVSGDPYIIIYGPSGSSMSQIRQRVTSTSFTEFCNTSGNDGGGQVPTVLNNSAPGNIIQVSSIYVNDTTPGTTTTKNPTPAPAPCSGKNC